MSGACVHPCERVSVIYVHGQRRQGPWNLPKSSGGTHCSSLWIPGIKANYNALRISIIGDSNLQGQDIRPRYGMPLKSVVRPFKHSGRKINISDGCISHRPSGRAVDFIATLNSRLYKFESLKAQPEHNFIQIIQTPRGNLPSHEKRTVYWFVYSCNCAVDYSSLQTAGLFDVTFAIISSSEQRYARVTVTYPSICSRRTS